MTKYVSKKSLSLVDNLSAVTSTKLNMIMIMIIQFTNKTKYDLAEQTPDTFTPKKLDKAARSSRSGSVSDCTVTGLCLALYYCPAL